MEQQRACHQRFEPDSADLRRRGNEKRHVERRRQQLPRSQDRSGKGEAIYDHHHREKPSPCEACASIAGVSIRHSSAHCSTYDESKRSVLMSRSGGKSTSLTRRIVPGLSLNTTQRSARPMASSTSWVTNSTVFFKVQHSSFS